MKEVISEVEKENWGLGGAPASEEVSGEKIVSGKKY